MPGLPFVVLFEEDGADQARVIDASLGKIPEPVLGRAEPDPGDVGAAFHLLVQALQWICAVQFGPVPGREGHVGEDVRLALVHEIGKLRPTTEELIGNVTLSLTGVIAVRLIEGLSDRGPGLSGIPCVGGRLNTFRPWPG